MASIVDGRDETPASESDGSGGDSGGYETSEIIARC